MMMGSNTGDNLALDMYVRRIYKHLQKERERDNCKLWQTQVETLANQAEKHEHLVKQQTVVYPMKLAKYETKNTACFKISSDDDNRNLKTENHCIIEMQTVPSEPKMVYWTQIDSNIRIKQTPKFYPASDSDNDSDDDPAVNALVKASTSSSFCSTNISFDNLTDDQLFVSLVTVLLKYESTGLEEELLDNLCDNLELPDVSSLDLKNSSVFNVIKRLFPNASFPFVLRDRYLHLIRGRRCSTVEMAKMISTTNGALSLSRDEILQSFHKLFCRRCYLFNCLIHTDAEKVEPVDCLSYPVKIQKEKKPCSVSCYMNVTSKSESSWTFEEISLYRAAYSIYPDYWCRLAKIIRTKDCSEVFEFSKLVKRQQATEEQHETRPSQDSKDIRSLKNIRKSSRKKTIKGWFNHCKRHDLLISRDTSRRPTLFPVYKPCKHKGLPCDSVKAKCPCFRKKITCEKFCGCVSEYGDCSNLFLGCQCKGVGDGACDRPTCGCYCSNRECDVDICGCGICSTIKDNNPNLLPCKNSSIQDHSAKKLYVDVSAVSGFGLFAGEDIKKDECIGEYVGEIISDKESEQRSESNDKNGHTYMFTKDKEHILDGKNFGNVLRFINSSSNPNAYPLVKNVSGDLRIGLFAQKDIIKGNELFFDYENALEKQRKKSLEYAKRKQNFASKEVKIRPTEGVETASEIIPMKQAVVVLERLSIMQILQTQLDLQTNRTTCA